ncbi:hypothetical protein CH267_13355 [Rhodococcus sp. 06-621-2]|nr:substrate-binding domain-containing protein [Rhodococcus sp. 06-621-2]OZC55551.1 hypothetical protein CH267_13355 [Rhodococcus sp. 06-621-2]
MPTANQKRWEVGDKPAFEEEARKAGVEVIVQNATDNEITQSTQIDQVLTQGVDLIVLAAVNVDSAMTLVSRAADEGVPVIAYNYMIETEGVVGVVTRDSVQVGRLIAQGAMERAPEGNYILAFGDQGTSVARDKAAGQMEVLQPAIDEGRIRIVSERFHAGWSGTTAQSQVEQALTANANEIAAVLASSDSIGYGAVQALSAQGLTGRVVVTGEDVEDAALQNIGDGSMALSVFTPFDEMARQAARMAVALVNGQTPEANNSIDIAGTAVPWAQVKTFIVEQNNLEQFRKDYPWWVV